MAAFGDYHAVSGAGWSAYWRIAQFAGAGLEIWWADFQGHRVMWRATQPFAIVPYHGRDPIYKDGFNPMCGGASFYALKHGAENRYLDLFGADAGSQAAVDTDAVVVTNEPADDFNPARLTITAKFWCGWYQYVHSWTFTSDGVINPRVAMGGHLNPYKPNVAHVHHMYFRVDLDIDGQYPHDVFEVFDHHNFNLVGGDEWVAQKKQGKLLANPDTARKWRVRSSTSQNAKKEFRSYELELPRGAGRDDFSTGDVWVTIYRGDGVEQGQDVGNACTDKELESKYAVGPLHPTTTGDDIVMWIVVRHHHEPRDQSEEANFLPFDYHEFAIVPRSFAELRSSTGGHGGG
jgi:hypothetical protein